MGGGVLLKCGSTCICSCLGTNQSILSLQYHQGLATKTLDPKDADAMLSAVDVDGNGKVCGLFSCSVVKL